MTRIAETFHKLKASGKKGFIPFVTAGDPDLDTSQEIVRRLCEKGADVIELGVPFSDPMADGPTIQRSSQRALHNGISVSGILDFVKTLRVDTDVPMVLFSYLNPLFRYGIEKLAVNAADAGVDGLLVTDVTGAEADSISRILNAHGIDLISLVAPTTTNERLQRIAEKARGFIYAISRAGVTGVREQASADAEALVMRIRQYTDLPVAVGFGISTNRQVKDVWRYADAAVVGSAIVAEIENNVVNDVVSAVELLLSQLTKSE